MKTKKQEITKKGRWVLLTMAATLFVYSPSFASKKKVSENKKRVPVSVNIDQQNGNVESEKEKQEYKKTRIQKWNSEKSCWEPWRYNEVHRYSEKETSEEAYTKIKVWNSEINDWEPYPFS